VSRFTVDAAARLPGPEPLRQRRLAAAERFRSLAWPTGEEEIWRYSRIGRLDLDRYTPAGGPADGAGPGDGAAPVPLQALPFVPASRCGLVVTVNGAVTHVDVAEGLTVRPTRPTGPPSDPAASRATGDADAEGNGEPDRALGGVTEPDDVFAVLNEAFVRDVVTVDVPRGAAPTAPFVVVHRVEGDGVAAFPRLVVRTGDASRVVVVEVLVGDADALLCPLVELRAGRDAQLGYLAVQDLGPRVWQIANQVAEAGTQATITSSVAAFGGDYARLRTDCRLVGRGATANLVSLYFGDRDQMLDFRTFQDHRAEDTTSDLLFKGAVDDHAHSVYSGLIRVRPNARGTNAFQTNRNVKLSEHAWAESVPNLEIQNNDVRCSHASTVGPIDLDQRFYLESRGVPPAVADRLILTGFFDEVIDRLPAPDLAADLRRRVAAKLGHGVGTATAGAGAGGPVAPAAPAVGGRA
jgi:Fe-S cluster assembly protein SufD